MLFRSLLLFVFSASMFLFSVIPTVAYAATPDVRVFHAIKELPGIDGMKYFIINEILEEQKDKWLYVDVSIVYEEIESSRYVLWIQNGKLLTYMPIENRLCECGKADEQ